MKVLQKNERCHYTSSKLLSINVASFTQAIKAYAHSLGIDLIGVASAAYDQVDAEAENHLQKFVEKKRHGSMSWLEPIAKRVRPEELLPGAKSVIVIGINYYRDQSTLSSQTAGGFSKNLEHHGRIARYAYGRDYHKVLKKILKQLVTFMKEIAPEFETNSEPQFHLCIDSSPLLERNYAVKAGLGFIGKNTMLITEKFGSFILLGEIITNLEFEYDKPLTGTCGTCTRCIDACPTGAIVQPHELDARKCISYLTIESKEPIPVELQPKMGNWIFGCDICQEVCPYNKTFAKPLQLEAFKEVKIAGSSLLLEEILEIKTDEDYLQKFAGSPLMRAKRHGLQRNAKIALKNISP